MWQIQVFMDLSVYSLDIILISTNGEEEYIKLK